MTFARHSGRTSDMMTDELVPPAPPLEDDPRLSPERGEDEENQWRKVLRVKMATLGVVIALFILFLGFAAASLYRQGQGLENQQQTIDAIRQTQQNGSPIILKLQETLEQAKVTADVIKSCTTPKGKCYQRSQEQTGDAIGSINEVTYLAATCADQAGVQGEKEIRECVFEKLEKQP